MLDLYLREIFTVQEIFMSQDKQLANLKTMNKFCLYILAAIEPEKKVSMGSEDESSLTEILCFFDQVILVFGKPWTHACTFADSAFTKTFHEDNKRTASKLKDNILTF